MILAYSSSICQAEEEELNQIQGQPLVHTVKFQAKQGYTVRSYLKNVSIKKKVMYLRGIIVQWIKVAAALVEDLSLVLNTHIVIHNHL